MKRRGQREVSDLTSASHIRRLYIHQGGPTFLAIYNPLGPWSTFATVPPFPLPSSPTTFRSSVLRSVLVLPFPPPRSMLMSCSESFCWYDTRGGGVARAEEVEDECE